MRIKSISLEWFRGGAGLAVLETGSKSLVIYGANGSGKSSFVDAIEFVLNTGKIGHLNHEYSGRNQERGILNTHKPVDEMAKLKILFMDGAGLTTEIDNNGRFRSEGLDATGMGTWDYRRTVLRQSEVSEFVQDTKAKKYSALLPLLGLGQMEVAAENLRQLAKAVEKESKLRDIRNELKQIDVRRLSAFGPGSNECVLDEVKNLHAKYCPGQPPTVCGESLCDELLINLDTRIALCTEEDRRYVALASTAALDLDKSIGKVREAGERLTGAAQPLIAEQLEVLKKTEVLVGKLGDQVEVACPACGRLISTAAFQAHVAAEANRLKAIIDAFDTWKSAIGALCDSISCIKSNLSKADLKCWREEPALSSLNENFVYLDGLSVEGLRGSCGEEDLRIFEVKLLPLIAAAASASKDAPPDAQALSSARMTTDVAKAVFYGVGLEVEIRRTETLLGFLGSLELGVRQEIRKRSKAIIDEISTEVQAMWAILHPGEAIEEVALHIPEDLDKAIDIHLKFFGVEQESPRLTLSEGHRNSLGLCIFLAMAMREADKDQPLFLDDVVVSLDRSHRGMIRELLEAKFSERQVILLTHDRTWYIELKQQLEHKSWNFKVLLPWDSPGNGIRWSDTSMTFGDPRSQLKDRPDAAANDVRKIMDTELPIIAERLQILLPYLRGDKNDMRMSHEILERLTSTGKRCFEVKAGVEYTPYAEAIAMFEETGRLLDSWANRGSHSPDVTTSEASKLVDACEKSLAFFKCPSCGKPVDYTRASRSELVQCQCGEIRWRYGKG